MNFYNKWLFIFNVIFISISSGFAQNTYSTLYEKHYKIKLEEYEKNIKVLMEIDKIPGIAVAFVKGEFIWSKGFGKINVENNTEINSESLFQNKTLVRFSILNAILQLYEEGKINLKDKITTKSFQDNPITYESLISKLGKTIFTKFDPESGFKISNTNIADHEYDKYFIEVIAQIEKLHNKRFQEYVKDKIWNPLLMYSTRFENKRLIMKNRVNSYIINRGDVANDVDNYCSKEKEYLKIRTTVNDMIKLVYGFISNKLYNNISYEELFLSEKEFQWTYQPVNGRFSFGFVNNQNDDNSIIVCFPQDTLAIAIASNLKNVELFPFFERLYEILMEEPYQPRPYFSNYEDRKLYSCLDYVYNYGLSLRPLNTNTIPIGDIDFNFLTKKIDEIKSDKLPRISGRDIEKFKKIGKFISTKLEEKNGEHSFKIYHQRGAIDFFHDYIQIYKNDKQWDEQFKLNTDLENQIVNWKVDWDKTLNDYTVRLSFIPGDNFQDKLSKMKKLFENKKVFPDYCHNLSLSIEQYSKLNQVEQAQGIGVFGIEQYKKCAQIYHALGISFAWFYDADVTYDLFKMAQEFTPPDYSRVEHFLEIAEEFKTWGKIKEAIEMIDRATKLDPKQPALFSCIGDLYLEINQKTRAKRFFNKAIKIDPEFEKARIQLNNLKDVN